MPSNGVSIIRDTASPALAAMQRSGFLQDEESMMAAATAVSEVVKQWLYAKDAGPHKSAASLGASPTGLYGEMAALTTPDIAPQLILCIINHPAARQRWAGGDIEPVNGKKLAIPARAESYGKRPAEYGAGGLLPVFGRNGVYGLALAKPVLRTRKRKGRLIISALNGLEPGLILFWLVDRVHQEPDPTVIPPDEDLLNAALKYLSQSAGAAMQSLESS